MEAKKGTVTGDGQSSQSDSDELPSPLYVPIFRSQSESPLKKKPMTDAERKHKQRAAETADPRHQRLEQQHMYIAAETAKQRQQRLEQKRVHIAANRSA